MASFARRGRTWRARVARLGVFESKTFDTKAEARAWAEAREADITAGKRGKIIPHSVQDALRQYAKDVSPAKRGARWEKVRLAKLERELGFAVRQLTDVRTADVAAWRDKALLTLAPGSVRREMVLLRSVFEIARKEWGWLRANPMDGIGWPQGAPARARRISDDEIDRILLALNYERGAVAVTVSQRVAVAFLWALETAMRAGELTGLAWEDVSVEGRFAALPRTKNGDAREVPLSSAAIALLKAVPGEKGSLFRLSPDSLDALFRKARKRAGVQGVRFHDSRREAITRLAKRLDVLELARMVGHRDLRSLMVYYRATASEIAARLG